MRKLLIALLWGCLNLGAMGQAIVTSPIHTPAYSQQPATFSPLSLSPALWLDASDASTVTLVSSAVSQWSDKSGNGRHATQATVARRPGYNATGMNGGPTLTLSSQYIEGSVPINTTTMSVWGVFTSSSTNAASGRGFSLAANSGSVDYNSAGAAMPIYRNSSATDIRSYRNGTLLSTATVTVDVPVIYVTIWDGTNNTTYLNGTASASVGSAGNFGTSVYSIGEAAGIKRGEYWTGNVAEIGVTNTALSTIERQKLEGHLAWKRGMASSLPTGHPYKSAAP